jgi:hypothetical protein
MSSPEYADEPVMRVPLTNGEYLEAKRDNTRLFTFLGRTAIDGMELDSDNFNHIFLTTSETETSMNGSFIFSTNPVTGEPVEMFMQMAEYMQENRYPMILNTQVVPESDKAAYVRFREQAIDEAVASMNFEDLLGDD